MNGDAKGQEPSVLGPAFSGKFCTMTGRKDACAGLSTHGLFRILQTRSALQIGELTKEAPKSEAADEGEAAPADALLEATVPEVFGLVVPEGVLEPPADIGGALTGALEVLEAMIA